MTLYYLQDARQYVGNCMMWWKKHYEGYTSNILEAHIFTKKEVDTQQKIRPTDIPWPKRYIDGKIQHTVDCQYVRKTEAERYES